MRVKQIWTPPETGGRSRYSMYTLGGIAAITVLSVLLVTCGVFLSAALDLPRESFFLALVCGVTALAVFLALKIGGRSARGTAVILLTEDDRLFFWDTRSVSHYRRGVWGYAAGVLETHRHLRTITGHPFVPTGAEEILNVKHIREHRSYYIICCRTCRPHRGAAERICFLAKGLAGEEPLLRQLERRQSWENTLEAAGSHALLGGLISGAVLALLFALCLLSHPALGKLPQVIYFPCLGATFLAFFFLAYFTLRLHRGNH